MIADSSLFNSSNNNFEFFKYIIFLNAVVPSVAEPIVFLDTPTEQVATEGMEYVIKCEVTGDPLPEIQWKVRGQAWQGKLKTGEENQFFIQIRENSSRI